MSFIGAGSNDASDNHVVARGDYHLTDQQPDQWQIHPRPAVSAAAEIFYIQSPGL